MRRHRNAKIIATIGPATASREMIRRLFLAGADVFRLNFSHGEPDEHRQCMNWIRGLEEETGRPVGVLMDLQGPKLRVGRFREGRAKLSAGCPFRLDRDSTPGDEHRVELPHAAIFDAIAPGTELLLDDGRVRLRVEQCGPTFAQTVVVVGGLLSDHKGVNVPDVVLPLSALTSKDERDLEIGLSMGVDWVALSFVQRVEDVLALRERVDGRAAILSKLEKPAAIEHLDAIVEHSDGVMVARGDLGVELPPEAVPSVQKRVVRACRAAGKPVAVATQMLESMIRAPVPTRAEASDVAGAVYDGADAVMLSGETAVGKYPVEAVAIMDRIIRRVERDPYYRKLIDAQNPEPQATVADALCSAMRQVAHTLPVVATVTYTNSGFTTLRAARERPESPVLALTPHATTARQLSLAWGVHATVIEDIEHVHDMIGLASRTALEEEFAHPGEVLVIMAGMPFGSSGTTNLLHVTKAGEPRPAD